ncbi:MAG: CBS domain-containing protein [Pseudomonadota bacterium]
MLHVHDVLALKGNVIYSIDPDQMLKEGIRLLVVNDVGSLLVVKDGILLGLLTFREVLSAMNRYENSADVTVRECMVTNIYVVSPSDLISHVSHELLIRKVRYVPVVDKNMIHGVISFHDIQKAESEERHFENQLLKRYIRDWPEEAAANS